MSLYLAVFGKPRYLGLVDIGDLELGAGRWVVIETLRGIEMALLGGTLSREQEGKYRNACLEDSSDEHTRGPEPMLQEVTLIGPADSSQIYEHDERRLDEEAVLIRSRQILRGHQFQMKLVDVEYTMDRKKLFFYFTSDQRVDFRAYVRDLAKEFRIRIEMRQIGVRDEAKTVRGVSPCGRPCCCSYWLHRFTPINIRMVKEQNLALNPTKISGICGRLMCCMFYEHSTYSELWKNLPSPGTKIKAPSGNYILEGVDLHTEMVRVTFPEGGETPIPIAKFELFKETILRGETWQIEEKKETEHDHRFVLQHGGMSVSEERITERASAERAGLDRANSKGINPHLQPVQDLTSQASVKAEESSADKKRHRKWKDARSGLRKQEEKMRTAQRTAENEEGVKVLKERNKPTDNVRPDTRKDVHQDTLSGTQARNAHKLSSHTHSTHTHSAHGRHRPKLKGGNQGSGNTGSAGKVDS